MEWTVGLDKLRDQNLHYSRDVIPLSPPWCWSIYIQCYRVLLQTYQEECVKRREGILCTLVITH